MCIWSCCTGELSPLPGHDLEIGGDEENSTREYYAEDQDGGENDQNE